MYYFDAKQHIHLLDEQPLYGTSTLIKEVMPPFLAKWGAQCAVDWLKENDKDWDGAVMAWSKVRKEAAEKGTDLHASLEEYVVRMLTDFDGRPQYLNDGTDEDPNWKKVQAFAKWAVLNLDHFIFAEKNTYSKELWVGGVVDCLARLKDGRLVVIDFKSSKEAYFNQFVQAAGYAYQLEESGYGTAKGDDWNVLVEPIQALVVVPFGGRTLDPVMIENVSGYKDVFKSVVQVYGFLNSYNKK